jgi:hypothetical protein
MHMNNTRLFKFTYIEQDPFFFPDARTISWL